MEKRCGKPLKKCSASTLPKKPWFRFFIRRKNYTNGKKKTALTNFLVRNRHKNFWLSRLGGRVNLETFQKFKGKEEKISESNPTAGENTKNPQIS